MNEIASQLRFVAQMCDASAGLEGPDLRLALKELSGVTYRSWLLELTVDSSASNIMKTAIPTTVIDPNSPLGNQQYQD